MGRRSDHTREQLLEMAISSAYKIIKNEGHAGLTARKVAADIGYAVGTIYTLFENLDELSLKVKVLILEELYSEISDIKIGNDPESALLKLVEIYFAHTAKNELLWKSIFERHDSADGDLPDWYLTSVAKPFSVVEQAMKPLFPDSDEDAKKAARVLWSGIHGIASLAMGGHLDVVSGESPERMARDMVVRYVTGIKAA